MLAGIDNDRIREILPLLRPRSPEPTLFSQTVFYLLGIGLALLVILYLTRKIRQSREQESLFRQLGHDLGLKKGQIEFLRLVSRRLRLKRPRRLLTSASFFERHIGDHATKLANKSLDHNDLPRIADIRQALGFDELSLAQALTSTRHIEKGQTLLVWETDDLKEGFTPWILVDRDEASLTMSPLLREQGEVRPAHMGIGDEISIRFWRDGDTEYRFDTHVIRLGVEAALVLRHTGAVERLQQRDFVRVNTQFPVTFYELEEASAPDVDGPALTTQAAVAMLDNEDVEDEDASSSDASESGWEALNTSVEEQDSDPADADPADADPGGSAPSAAKDHLPLDKTRQIHGQAVNISAGGIGVLLHGNLPESRRWLVDPDFKGSFPLASIVCTVVGEQKGRGEATVVKLKFEELTSGAEKDIVRQVYEHQILEVGGIGGHSPSIPHSPDRPVDADRPLDE